MFISSILSLLKGRSHAERTSRSIPGRDGRKCGGVHSFTAICKQTVSDICGIRVLARACADERSRDFGTMPSDSIQQESCALIAAARRVGCFIEITEVPGTRYTIRTGESDVRMVQKDQIYYKIKNPFAKLHLKKHPPEYVLFDHVVHNILFPDCRLDFLGVGESCHEARLIFRQRAIRSDMRPNDAQISEYLRQLGFYAEGRYCFGNDYAFVTDVGQDGDNVIVDDDGRLRFIDPIIGFKTSLLQCLSNALSDEREISKLVSTLYCQSSNATIG